jgi:Zn-dependent protease
MATNARIQGTNDQTKQGMGFAFYLALHSVWFAGTTLLLTWGLFVLFFLAIGGFSLDGLMHQLNNLASRYVAADAIRASSFGRVVLAAHLLLSGAIVFFRRHSILPHKRSARHG